MQKRDWIRKIGVIVLLSAAVAIGLNIALLYADLAQYSERYQEASELLYSVPFAQQLLSSGIVVPILEELIFRGLFFRLLKKWLAFPWAMLVSAVIFGIYHGNLVQLVYASLCGLLFAYLYEKTGLLWSSIFSHMVMNLTAIILTRLRAFEWMMKDEFRMLAALLICIGVFTSLFMVISVRYHHT